MEKTFGYLIYIKIFLQMKFLQSILKEFHITDVINLCFGFHDDLGGIQTIGV